ncbi:hypothetical protein ACHAWF_002221 [Thalassiosira exigua]
MGNCASRSGKDAAAAAVIGGKPPSSAGSAGGSAAAESSGSASTATASAVEGNGPAVVDAVAVVETDLSIPSTIDGDDFEIPVRAYLPDGPASLPLRASVFFVHGGIFSEGDRTSHPLVARALAKMGTAVVAASFRNGEEAPHRSNITTRDLRDVANYCKRRWEGIPFGLVGSSSVSAFAARRSSTNAAKARRFDSKGFSRGPALVARLRCHFQFLFELKPSRNALVVSFRPGRVLRSDPLQPPPQGLRRLLRPHLSRGSSSPTGIVPALVRVRLGPIGRVRLLPRPREQPEDFGETTELLEGRRQHVGSGRCVEGKRKPSADAPRHRERGQERAVRRDERRAVVGHADGRRGREGSRAVRRGGQGRGVSLLLRGRSAVFGSLPVGGRD